MGMAGNFSILLAILFLANINSKINAQTAIPSKPEDINTWFATAIKPASQATTLEPNVKEAENGEAEVIEVRQDGSGKYKTISDAVKHVKVGNTKRKIISVGPGEYREKVKIERFQAYITMMASDPKNMPTIVYSGTAAQYGTDDSATLIVDADYFVAINMIIANAAPRPAEGAKGGQAVAMRITGDRAAFYNCRFTGFQDTLEDDKGHHLFKDCYIEGTCDFIFGEARSIYLNCEIKVISGDHQAFITAHGRKNVNDLGGYAFVHCKVTGSGKPIGYLGRPWFDASKAVWLHTEISEIINPEGWSDNAKPELQKTVFFGEFENKGPGATPDKRVPWTKKLTPKEAEEYMSLEYIDALKWLIPPLKGVPAGGASTPSTTPAASPAKVPAGGAPGRSAS